jgi:hypothetical protein
MRYKSVQGNAIIEFLIYVLVAATFIQLFIDFYLIARNVNDLNKVGNLITSSVSKNPKTIDNWNSGETKKILIDKYQLSNVEYFVYCKPLSCSNSPESISLRISERISILGIQIPISLSKNASVSRFLSFE